MKAKVAPEPHTASEPIPGDRAATATATALNDDDRAILSEVESSLANGLQLKAWWDRTSAADSFTDRFPTALTLNRPDQSFAFFDHALVNGRLMPILGDMQDLFYDRIKMPDSASPDIRRAHAEWMRAQIQEFILHYYARVSSSDLPKFYEPGAPAPPAFLNPFGLCPGKGSEREGFGQKQLYYKLRETGKIGKFTESELYAIADMREIGTKYQWIVGDARMFGFDFKVTPLGPMLPYAEVPLRETQLAVLSPDFVTNKTYPADSGSESTAPDERVLEEYGYGLATLKIPTNRTPVAYGPGFFDAGFMTYTWRVLASGETRARMVFVVNQPDVLVNPVLSPAAWGIKLADALSFGMVNDALNQLPRSVRSALTDPVFGSIALANLATFGQAGKQLCISDRDLNKLILFYHYLVIYTLIVNSLFTFRQIPDWLDASALPEWVVKGTQS